MNATINPSNVQTASPSLVYSLMCEPGEWSFYLEAEFTTEVTIPVDFKINSWKKLAIWTNRPGFLDT